VTVTRQPVTGRTRDLVILADKTIFRLAKHWLLLANLFWGLYVGLPVLAPVFMNVGWTIPAKVIYIMYRPLCHQMPTRSYFIGGSQVVYSPQALTASGVDIAPFSRDIGNQAVGWKVAFCERDVAIYGAIVLTGLVFGLIRRRLGKWQMRWQMMAVLTAPIAIDGTLQLFGLYESTWFLRTITGVVFGVGGVLFAYPYLEEGFRDVRQTINDKLHLE
jgi:uncharacterized membrane protein